LGYMHVNGPAGRAAQKATQVILLCRHGGEKQTSSNRRDRLYKETLPLKWDTTMLDASVGKERAASELRCRIA